MLSKIIKWLKNSFDKNSQVKVIDNYRIVAVDDSYQDTGKVMLRFK